MDMTNWQDRLTTFPLNGKVPSIPFGSLLPGEKVFVPPGCNTGIATGARSGIVVIDCDNDTAAVAFVGKYNIESTYTVKTPRGYHFYFQAPSVPVRNSVGTLLPKVDVRGEGGLVVAAGSTRGDGAQYEVYDATPPMEMPGALLVDLEALAAPEREAAPVQAIDLNTPEGQRRLGLAKQYLEVEAPPAIQGQNGSGALFTVALKLMRSMQLPIEAALDAVLAHYNPRCDPPWTEQEIIHKLEDARDNSDRPPGVAPPNFLESLKAKRTSRTAAPQEDAEPASGDEPRPAASKLKQVSLSEAYQVLCTHPDWEGVFGYDVISRTRVARRLGPHHPPVKLTHWTQGELTRGALTEIRRWFESEGGTIARDALQDVIDNACENHPFNPFVEYLDDLPPSEGVLPQLHSLVLNSPDGPMASSIITKQLVAAVRRARSVVGLSDAPAEAIDHRIVVILDGSQETGKSSFLRQLGGHWYCSIGHSDLSSADTRARIAGKVIIEMEEMAAMKKTDREALKEFISSLEDEYRKPYERSSRKVRRTGVIFGTSNDIRLGDPTGNTRFAPIQVGKMCGAAKMLALRDRIWSEANALAQDQDFDHHLNAEEKAFCESRTEVATLADPLVDDIRKVLGGVPFVTIKEVYRMLMLGEAKPVMDSRDVQRYADALKGLGCNRERKNQVSGWTVPESIWSQPPSAVAQAWLKQDSAAARVRDSLLQKAN